MDATAIILSSVIGVVAGFIGGLAGIGGSLIMLPALVILMGLEDPEVYHAYMAASMLVNIAVSVPAALRHHRAKAVRMDVLKVVLPVMMVTILIGVLLSNLDEDSAWLRLLLAAFIAVYCVLNLFRFFRKSDEPAREQERMKPPVLLGIGGGTGLLAGLLGIGGGIVMVPMLQVFTRLQIRHAIGTSSAIMCLTAVVGATFKVWTLPGHGQSPWFAIVIALTMAPGAIIGAWTGARVMHAMPLQAVRVAISLLLLIAAAKLAESALTESPGLAAGGESEPVTALETDADD